MVTHNSKSDLPLIPFMSKSFKKLSDSSVDIDTWAHDRRLRDLIHKNRGVVVLLVQPSSVFTTLDTYLCLCIFNHLFSES